MRSVEQISHALDGYAAMVRPELDAHRMRAVSQAITSDGRVRADRLDGFLPPHVVPLDVLERGFVTDLNPASIAAGTVLEIAITVLGAEENDAVLLGPPADLNAGLMVCGVVTARDEVTIRIFNGTAGSINPNTRQWRIVLTR